MTKSGFTFVSALLMLAGAMLSSPPHVNAAALSINPSMVAADYAGAIGLTITGLNPGQTVVVEKFLDLNGNGAVDGGDILVQHFTVTDGPPPLIDGQRNTNVPGDEDQTANGQIQTAVRFAAQSETNRAIAKFVYRVSTSGGLALASAPFTVTQLSFPQGVMGRVTSGGSPVPAAFVALLPPSGKGLVAATVSDATGKFALNVAPGSYLMIALKSGQVFNATTAPTVTVNGGAITMQDLSLSAGNRTISGRLTAALDGTGIAGVQVAVSLGGHDSGPPVTLVFTDGAGNFSAAVSTAASKWKVEFSAFDAVLQGYVPVRKIGVDTSAGDVSNVSAQWITVNALIYGTLKDNLGHPLAGIQVQAGDSMNLYQSGGLTDANGNYSIGVLGGSWFVGTNSDDPALAGYMVAGENVAVSDGQAVAVNLVAQQASSHLQGKVRDNLGAPVSNITVGACPQNQGSGQCPSANSGADGSFDIAVSGGDWNLFVETTSAAQLGVVGSSLTVTVGAGQTLSGLALEVMHATAQITGAVRDTSGNPIANSNVGADINMNGTNFNANSQTDAEGNYSLAVFNGQWNVGLDCQDLTSRGFSCPPGQSVTVDNNNPVADFTVQGTTCVGDCDGDGTVTIDEIIKMVNIALGSAPISECEAGDRNGDQQITIDEIILAVTHALGTC